MKSKHMSTPRCKKLIFVLLSTIFILILTILFLLFKYDTFNSIKEKTCIPEIPSIYSSPDISNLGDFSDKSILFLGDSITAGTSSGKYVDVVDRLLNFKSIKNLAIGGTKLAHVDGEENCLVDIYQDIEEECDIIFFMVNTNDYAWQIPIGDSESSDPSTYFGSLNIIFTWLKENYKDKTILISSPIRRKINYDTNMNPLPIEPYIYAQAVVLMANKYEFPIFDAYNFSQLDFEHDFSHITTNDHLHPNRIGAELLGREISVFIDKNYE